MFTQKTLFPKNCSFAGTFSFWSMLIRVAIGGVPIASAIALEAFIACSLAVDSLAVDSLAFSRCFLGWTLLSVDLVGCIIFRVECSGGTFDLLHSKDMWTELMQSVVSGVQVESIVLSGNFDESASEFRLRTVPTLEALTDRSLAGFMANVPIGSLPVLVLTKVALLCLNRLDASTVDSRLGSLFDSLEGLLLSDGLGTSLNVQQALWDVIFFWNAVQHTPQQSHSRAADAAAELLVQLTGAALPICGPQVAFSGPDAEGSDKLESLAYQHLAYPSPHIWEHLRGIKIGFVRRVAWKEVAGQTKLLVVHSGRNWVCDSFLVEGNRPTQRRSLSGGNRLHVLAAYYRLLC